MWRHHRAPADLDWTHCGRRIDLEARCIGWQPLGLRQAISDAEAVWNGTDDASWELEGSD